GPQRVGTHADLVQPENLVVDDPVEELERAGAEEQARPEARPADHCRQLPPLRPQQHDRGEEHGRGEEVEEAVREDLPVSGRVDVEVVPLQELVEDDLVAGPHQADAGHGARPGRAAFGARPRPAGQPRGRPLRPPASDLPSHAQAWASPVRSRPRAALYGKAGPGKPRTMEASDPPSNAT